MGCVLWVGEHVCDQVHVNNNNNNNNNNNKLKRTLSITAHVPNLDSLTEC